MSVISVLSCLMQTLFSGRDQCSGQHRSEPADRADGGWAAGESAGVVCAAGTGGETSQWKSQREGSGPQGIVSSD